MDIYSKEGVEELSEKLDGIVLHNVGTTAVEEKDIPPPSTVFHNAPETLEAAIERLMEAEMRLEDLARACEIASITRQMEIVEAFKTAADEYLQTKITINQPETGDIKLNVVTGTLDTSKFNKETT
jgi:hypothetical protein